MAYTYDRAIFINGVEFTFRISACSFTWSDPGGCNTASLILPGLMFDDFGGVNFGDVVKIYHSRTRTYDLNGVWTPELDTFVDADLRWQGHVVDMTTSLEEGLTLSCNGYALTYLKEWDAFGRYGTTAVVTAPADLAIEQDTTIGNVGKGVHKYYVFAGDSLGFKYAGVTGETVNTTVVETGSPAAVPPIRLQLTWSDVPLAARYRVYKAFTAAMIAAEVGAGNETGAAYTRYYYTDVVENRFVDDGLFAWASCQYVETLPTVDTCAALATVNTKISEAIKTVLSDRVPALYDAALITGGAATDAEDLNYDDNVCSIYEMLETLANLVGDITWGVNALGKVYFKQKPTLFDTAAAMEAAILMTKTIGEQISPEDLASVDVFDILVGGTRNARRDGITEIATMVSADLRAKLLGSAIADDSASGERVKRQNVTWGYVVGRNTQDVLSADPATVFGTPQSPIYADVDAFEVAYPGLGWLYRLWLLDGNSARVGRILQTILMLMQPTAQNPAGGRRSRGIIAVPAGTSGEISNAVYATNIMRDAGSTGGTWSIQLTRAQTEILPGQKLFAVIATNGTRYVMEIRSVDYTYEDDAIASLTCGELDTYAMAMQQHERVLRELAATKTPDEAIPGIGNPTMMATRALLEDGTVGESALYPQGATLGRTALGTSPIPASVDHAHDLPKDTLNKMINKDGQTLPNMARMFRAADLTALAAQTGTTRGLRFQEGDLSKLITDPTARTRVLEDGAWVPLGRSRAHCIVFPAIPAEVTDIELGGMYWHAGPGDSVWVLDSFVFTNATGVVGTNEYGVTP